MYEAAVTSGLSSERPRSTLGGQRHETVEASKQHQVQSSTWLIEAR